MTSSFNGFSVLSQIIFLFSVTFKFILPILLIVFIAWAVLKIIKLQGIKNNLLAKIVYELKNKK